MKLFLKQMGLYLILIAFYIILKIGLQIDLTYGEDMVLCLMLLLGSSWVFIDTE